MRDPGLTSTKALPEWRVRFMGKQPGKRRKDPLAHAPANVDEHQGAEVEGVDDGIVTETDDELGFRRADGGTLGETPARVAEYKREA